jgi:hypothetical protein
MDPASFRLLLQQYGSYPAIEAAAASGGLHELLPVTLCEHIGTVYHRLEAVADAHLADIAKLRLAVLLHEESPTSLPSLLAAAGFADFAPTVIGVIRSFGELWKTTGDREIAGDVLTHREHLAPLLLFELAHEERAIPEMQRAAEIGGLDPGFKRWVDRLPTATPSNSTFERLVDSPSLEFASVHMSLH